MAQDLLDPLHPGPGQSRLQAALFVALLTLGGVASLSTHAARTAPEGKSILRGAWTADWEHRFDEAMPLRQAGIDLWGIIEWFGFHTARRGALVGDGGWMFTSEEFETLPDEAKELQRKIAFIEQTAATLHARHVALAIAFVPTKARVCREHLGRYRLHAADRYADTRAALVAADLRVPDLLGLLNERGCEGSFLRTDTHWSPGGAAATAAAVAESLRTGGVLGSLPHAAFKTVLGEVEDRSGDLLRYLPLGPLQRFGPPPDRVTLAHTEATEAAPDLGAALFGDAAAPPVTLIGTSYSENPTWNFAGALEDALQADVLNLGTEAGGPFTPMIRWLADPDSREHPPRLVVWEIPERYLPVAYDLAPPGPT